MSGYGEPWAFHFDDHTCIQEIKTADGITDENWDDTKYFERAVVCVNALADVDDPAAWVTMMTIEKAEWKLFAESIEQQYELAGKEEKPFWLKVIKRINSTIEKLNFHARELGLKE